MSLQGGIGDRFAEIQCLEHVALLGGDATGADHSGLVDEDVVLLQLAQHGQRPAR